MELIHPQDTSFRHGINKYKVNCKSIKALTIAVSLLLLLGAFIGLVFAWPNGAMSISIGFFLLFGIPFIFSSIYSRVGENIKVTVGTIHENNNFSGASMPTIGAIVGVIIDLIFLFGIDKLGVEVCVILTMLILWFIDWETEKSCNWQDAKDYSILCCQKYGIYIPNSDDLKTISEVRNTVESILINQKNTPEP